MASAVPYDPYDDLDNNPFAEPHEDSEPVATNTDDSSYIAKEQTTSEGAAVVDRGNNTADISQEDSGREDRAAPVSYTHLDVYKRQYLRIY